MGIWIPSLKGEGVLKVDMPLFFSFLELQISLLAFHPIIEVASLENRSILFIFVPSIL